MSISEIKSSLHKEIDKISDEELLKEISAIIHRAQDTNDEEEWNKLPPDVRQSIEEGLSQLEKGHVISNKEFLIRFGKWNMK